MEFQLHPSFTVPGGTFNILVAPDDILLRALEAPLRRERLRVLYVCGNYSRFLSRLDRRCPDFHVRRAFTAYQLVSILEEADQSFIVVEHDLSLYDDAPELAKPIALACADRAQASTLLILAPAFDPVLRAMSEWAHRVAYIEKPRLTRPGVTRGHGPVSSLRSLGQTTLEIF